jgi:hypothetical protein
MKLVIKKSGAYDLNWTWLPYWVVADQEFRDAAGVIMHATAAANPDDDETLDKLNEAVTQALVNRYPESGIAELIEALSKTG